MRVTLNNSKSDHDFPQSKFVIVGTQRTGSSAYAEALNSHPGIACGWEWGQKALFIDKTRVAESAYSGDFSMLRAHERDHILSLLEKRPDWIGYRRLFRSSDKWIIKPAISPAIWADQMDRYIAWLSRNQGIHVIHIVRRDNIAWLRSKYMANLTRSFVGKSYPDGVSIKIPIEQAVRRILSKEFVDGRLATLSGTNPYLRINYEEFLDNRDCVIADSFSFLDCAPLSTEEREQTIRRQSIRSPEEQVINYAELHDALSRRGLLYSNVET